MYKLFNMDNTAQSGIIKYPEWNYIRDGLKKNLGTVLRFHRHNPMAVKSNHFLVQLLQSITVPQSQNLERYYDNVDRISLNMGMVFKMTSSIYKGHIFNGIFYGPDNPEILIADNASFDIFDANKNWESLSPVNVIRHFKSDLGLNIPDGTLSGSESGLSVIVINIPMLAVQYRAFRINEMYISDGEFESQRSIMQFIYMYVLPNMLESHLDCALFNRINNLQNGAPLGETNKRHSFYIIDFASKVQAFHEKVLKGLDSSTRNFVGILRTIPAVTKSSMEEVFMLPDMAYTRQVTYALVIARLQVILFLFKSSKYGASVKNSSEVNLVRRNIVAYRSDNMMKSTLPQDTYFDVQQEIDEIALMAV